MKKTITFLLLISLLCLTLTACSNDNKQKTSNINTSEQVSENQSANNSNVEEAEWGVPESRLTIRNNIETRAYIKFPFLAGIIKGPGLVAYQTDGSLVFLSTEMDYKEPDINDRKSENIFPAYFEKTIDMMSAYRRIDHENFNFEISSKENVKINDYEMCKYKGLHTFTVKGEEKSISYVAYATKLKANDAVVYWMVLDDTEDQSLGSVIESHADKMAESLHE